MGKLELSEPDKDHLASSPGCLYEARIQDLLLKMTLAEKIGQLNQVNFDGAELDSKLKSEIREGRVGSVLNQVNKNVISEIQKVAIKESRLGIPLLIGRDVIHGFSYISPIPLGQAASFNPEIVQQCARLSAVEARQCGINWAFSPMIDVSRDPRWGRIAESFGEDPLLNALLGVAMIQGFQGSVLSPDSLMAACAKHFVGYGASEGGRDYNTTNIASNELNNIYLPPFKAAVEAGVASLMTSFSDLDGIPATANDNILSDILRDNWNYEGVVLSDWAAIEQLVTHGIAENNKAAASLAMQAGVDMDMESHAYSQYLEDLIEEGILTLGHIDKAVGNILSLKFKLGLFETTLNSTTLTSDQSIRDTLKTAAAQSLVLLKNKEKLLPLNPDNIRRVSLIGPMIDAPYEQLGTWIFDGNSNLTITPLMAAQSFFGDMKKVHGDPAMDNTRSNETASFSKVAQDAKASDAIILCLGEEAILSGEAHSRANIRLPGAQEALINALHKTGKPLIAVIMAGRPIVLSSVLDKLDAVIFAWHPGTMGGEAIIDLIMGRAVPSGKLPVTFPKSVGQIPIYYNHKNTGRPADPDRILHIDDIEAGASQTSFGMTSFYLDDGYQPAFPFGFGLSYTNFEYSDVRLSKSKLVPGETLTVSVTLTNKGNMPGIETVQLYIRDLVASLTRPVKELKTFERIHLDPQESKVVKFKINEETLAFYQRDSSFGAEPGRFHIWVGPDSSTSNRAEFDYTVNSVDLDKP